MYNSFSFLAHVIVTDPEGNPPLRQIGSAERPLNGTFVESNANSSQELLYFVVLLKHTLVLQEYEVYQDDWHQESTPYRKCSMHPVVWLLLTY